MRPGGNAGALRRFGIVGIALLLWASVSAAQGIVMPKVVQDAPGACTPSAQSPRVLSAPGGDPRVGAQGATTDVSVDTPRGHGVDEAAVAAARRLRFSPAKKDGKPGPARIKSLQRCRGAAPTCR